MAPILGIAALAGLLYYIFQPKKEITPVPEQPIAPPLPSTIKPLPTVGEHPPLVPKAFPYNPGKAGQGIIVEKGKNVTLVKAQAAKQVTLRAGDKGPAVLRWQTAIGEPTTGIMDTNTVFMTKEFQKNHKLTPDGVVGPKTWALIK